MGGRIIQPGKLWELARARLLRETLRNGAHINVAQIVRVVAERRFAVLGICLNFGAARF